MRKIHALVLAGMSAFLIPLARAAEMPLKTVDVGGSIKRTVNVQIKGKLRIDLTELMTDRPASREIFRPFASTLYISAGGQSYYLDYGSNKTLGATVGSIVIVTGTLEEKGNWHLVHVTNMRVAESAGVRVRLHGTLSDWRHKLKALPAPAICGPLGRFLDRQLNADGITYTLKLNARDAELAERLPGEPVIVAGRMKGTTIEVTSLQADNVRYFRAPDNLIEIRGKLKDLSVLSIDGNIYRLNFVGKQAEEARKLEGRTVVLNGVHKVWLLSSPRGEKGPHIHEIQVNRIQPVDEEYVRRTVTVEVRGTVQYARCLRWGRGAMSLQGYWLHFTDPRLYDVVGKFNGEAVIVTGTEEINDKKEKVLHVTSVRVGTEK